MISNSELLARMTPQQRDELIAELPALRSRIYAEMEAGDAREAAEFEEWMANEQAWEMDDNLADRMRDETRDRLLLEEVRT